MSFYDAGTIDTNGNAINFHYQIATFTDGTQLYQEIDPNGNMMRFADMNGNTVIALPTAEYSITDTWPARPSWGT